MVHETNDNVAEITIVNKNSKKSDIELLIEGVNHGEPDGIKVGNKSTEHIDHDVNVEMKETCLVPFAKQTIENTKTLNDNDWSIINATNHFGSTDSDIDVSKSANEKKKPGIEDKYIYYNEYMLQIVV